eukprot:scaffold6334_cov139-Skeletonema_menzelii.AAC.3
MMCAKAFILKEEGMEKKDWQAMGPDDFRPSETSLIDMNCIRGGESGLSVSLRVASFCQPILYSQGSYSLALANEKKSL